MLFSVVIPLYNKADTIERAIRSVWAQSFKDYELIVVDDGSTDGSLDVARRLADESPITIVAKRNGGVSSARNAGANIADGKFIALLDGDDIWFSNHLEQLADAIAAYPKVKFFGTGYERVSGKYIYYTIPWGGCRVSDVYSAFRYGQPINTSTVAIERDLWMKVGGFDERYSFYEDYEFFFRLGIYTMCCNIRDVSGKYMDDAITRATAVEHEVTRLNYPHLSFVENRILNAQASREMVSCAVTHLKLIAYGCNKNVLVRIAENFPCLARVALLCGLNGNDKFVKVNQLHGLIFTLVYKIRCHLIMWRKRA